MRYFAYGSNLWRNQMRHRCPDAMLLGMGCLYGYRWIITKRGYASIIQSPGDVVYGSVYEVGFDDVAALDQYEGVAQGAYYKELVLVECGGRLEECMTYVDPVQVEGIASQEYCKRINAGLCDAELPPEYVAHNIRPFIPPIDSELSHLYGRSVRDE